MRCPEQERPYEDDEDQTYPQGPDCRPPFELYKNIRASQGFSTIHALAVKESL